MTGSVEIQNLQTVLGLCLYTTFLNIPQVNRTSAFSNRKFGKQIQKRQLEIPEYAASFVDYKALKKVSEPVLCVWRHC
jgi:CDK inhibitor PHO81